MPNQAAHNIIARMSLISGGAVVFSCLDLGLLLSLPAPGSSAGGSGVPVR